MINKSQIMTWRNIGYYAQELICRCDSNASVEKLAEMAEAIREKMNRLDILELKQLHTEKNIAFTEYADMISETIDKEPADIARTRNRANALLKIVVDMRYGSLKDDEFYKKIAEEGDVNAENKISLGDLLKYMSFEDVKLTHKYEEIELSTIVELDDNTLTQSGKEHWEDVMNAKVNRIFVGGYGLQIECEDVEPERLADFSHVLAGYCDADLYDTWINDGNDESHEEPTMNI